MNTSGIPDLATSPGTTSVDQSVEEKKDRILTEAMKAFARDGFEGASIRKIAESAGVKHQNIAHYFGSKEELLDEAMNRELQRFMKLGEEVGLANPDNPEEQFRLHIRHVINALVQHIGLLQVYCREGMQHGPRHRKLLEAHISRLERKVIEQLSQGIEDGVLRDDLPLDDLFLVYKGALIYRFLVPAESEYFSGIPANDPRAIDAHTDAMAKLFLKS